MISNELLQKYAALAVRTGANVQKGQLMVLTASVECAAFARLCIEEAYRAGASEVRVNWTDEHHDRLRFEYEEEATLAQVAPWRVEQKKNDIGRGCCYLYIDSDTPGLLSHIPGDRLQAANQARQSAFEPFRYYTMNNLGQWSIVAIPTQSWAEKVFPGDGDALQKLWSGVLMSARVGEDNDPVAEWRRHDEILEQNSAKLNEYKFKSLHFTNSLGTDLVLELVDRHVWAGGGSRAGNGAFFNPNMPTEEVFTMPQKRGVNGTVVATKPLNYQGKLIEGFRLTFHEGKVTQYSAQKGEDALKNLLTADEGSSYLGEVALVPYGSPISRSGVLFLSTLFDENASCHLALGEAYPENVAGGTDMDRAALDAAGANDSKEHCDFMFGSADLRVEGRLPDGGSLLIFENGDFAAAAGFLRE